MADVKLKITTVGDGTVGKTSLLVIFAKIMNELLYYIPSIYQDYTYDLTNDDKDFELTLIDTAGMRWFWLVNEIMHHICNYASNVNLLKKLIFWKWN